MNTEDRTPAAPDQGRARAGGDPLRMSEAEKRMAEWEARHDVAARGHRPAPDVLQHYLAHERLVHEREQRPSAGRAAGTAAGQADHRATLPAAPPAEKGTRGLLRRLFRRRD